MDAQDFSEAVLVSEAAGLAISFGLSEFEE